MKIYLWYDQLRKKYVTGQSNEFTRSLDEILYSFDLNQMSLSQKVANNLNRLR